MKLVELFCGTGGFSRGAHAAGFEVAVAYDIDPILTSSYPLNFPTVALHHRDVGDLTGAEIEEHVGGEVFGLFGGPPCQGFSEVGRRDPTDPRRTLLGHFFRLVAELQPAFFVMENVRGLNFPKNRPVLDAAITPIEPDYDILGPHIFDAAEFGAATRRPRLVVIGVRRDLGRAMRLADLEALKRDPANVRQAIGDLFRATPINEREDRPGFDRWRIARRGRATDYAAPLRAANRVFSGHRPTEHTEKVIARFAKVRPGRMDKVGHHPRLRLTGQCPTLRAGTGADMGSFQSVRPIHPVEHRVITVREAARLQGFPDEHWFHTTIWHSFRMIGNSVSPIMAGAIFTAIRDRLGLDLSSATDEPELAFDGREEEPLAEAAE